MKRLRENHVAPLLAANEDLALSGEVSNEVINFLGQQISRIESLVLKNFPGEFLHQAIRTSSIASPVSFRTFETLFISSESAQLDFVGNATKIQPSWRAIILTDWKRTIRKTIVVFNHGDESTETGKRPERTREEIIICFRSTTPGTDQLRRAG